jgi:hypothetical protein
MFTFGAYALIYLMTDQGEELLEHAVGLHHEMERLSRVLQFIERHAAQLAPSWRVPVHRSWNRDVRRPPSRHIAAHFSRHQR